MRPVLEYASTSWDPYQANHIHRVENRQSRAARVVAGQHQHHISIIALIQELQWRSLQERRLTARLWMFYKAVNGHAACDISEHMATTQRRARTSHKLQHAVPSTNTDNYRFNVFPRTINIWDILPAASVNVQIWDHSRPRSNIISSMGRFTPHHLMDRMNGQGLAAPSA